MKHSSDNTTSTMRSATARTLAVFAVFAVFAIAAITEPATAAPAPAQTAKGDASAPSTKIDRQLLRRLTRDIVDNVPTDVPTDVPADTPTGAAEPDNHPAAAPLGDAPGADQKMHRPQVADPAETLDRVAGAMREAGDLLGAAENKQRVRTLQDRAVEQLDALIEAARTSPPPSSGSPSKPKPDGQQPPAGDPKPGQPPPAAQSGAQAGTASSIRTDAEAEAEGRRSTERAQQWIERVWGHLPERQREQLRQFGTDVFLPGYESMIEDYFRRLAEEANE